MKQKGSKRQVAPLDGQSLPLTTSLFQPGLRLAVGLSGGADSVALLCALAARSSELGLALHAAHLHHGLRGTEADEDLEFCRALATRLAIPFHEKRVNVAAEAQARKAGIEEAARQLRYEWFQDLMNAGEVDAVATAHTLDDQAETVLGKFLRGAWTEGLSGIHPVVVCAKGRILRPLLGATRAEVEQSLCATGQSWREDSSNLDPAYTRNRIRHELLPLLETWNPKLKTHLAQMAELARDEEAWWQDELLRVTPLLLLEGTPVRGGGRSRAGGDAVAMDVIQLAALPKALARRTLRQAAQLLGVRLDFAATGSLWKLATEGRAGQKIELASGLRAERTARELRLGHAAPPPDDAADVMVSIPGEATGFGFHLKIASDSPRPAAQFRNWRAGDRVRLRYSNGEKKIKEVLERMQISGSERTVWPVLELEGRIVWMREVEVAPIPGLTVTVVPSEKMLK